MTPHSAIYARVSSRAQNTASQEPNLKRWAEGDFTLESETDHCSWHPRETI